MLHVAQRQNNKKPQHYYYYKGKFFSYYSTFSYSFLTRLFFLFQFQPQHPTHSKETERKTKEVEDGKREKENGHVSFFITKTDTITSSLTSLYFLLSLTLFLLANCKLDLIWNQQNITMKKHVIYEPQFVLGEEGIRALKCLCCPSMQNGWLTQNY